MRNTKRLLGLTVCGMLFSAPLTTTVFAADSSQKSSVAQEDVKDSTLSNAVVDKVNPYIHLNNDGLFEITSEEKLLELLTPEEIVSVKNQISIANETNLDVLEDKSGPGTVTMDKNQLILSINDAEISDQAGGYQLFSNGVNKVNFYWWGMKVYLSKTVINTAAASGIGAAGYIASTLKVKHPVGLAIAAALGAAGYLGTQIPHGVQLRVNYIPLPPYYTVTQIKYQ